MQTSETIHPEKMKAQATEGIHTFGRFLRFEQQTAGQKQVFLFYYEHANLAITFLNPETLRLKLYFGETVDFGTTVGVLEKQVESGSVGVTAERAANTVTLTTSAIRTLVKLEPFSLQLTDLAGNLVAEQQTLSWDEKGAVTCRMSMNEQSHFYGLGEKTSFLDKQQEHYTMWNTDVYAPHVPEIEALYQSIPFLIHFDYGKPTYGVFLDNPGKTSFDMRSRRESYSFRTETGELDVYLFYGPSIKNVIARYTELTGTMPLPPKWALGYHQSRYSYMNQAEVLELARTFRAKQIPCDVIHLDIHYMDEYRVFTWDKTRFPNPKAMMEELRELGFRIVPIVDPGVKKDPRYKVYQEGIAHNYFCRKLEGDLFIGKVWPGDSAFPDFTEDRVAQWWGDSHQAYIDSGVQGIWNDMNEPAVFNETKTMDLDVVHRNNGNPKTHGEIHNLYGMLMSKATYEGLVRHLHGQRPFVLTRAGYSGIQRYAAVWTGDNRSFWEHLALAMPMVLNLGMSGVPFAGPDIGGFAHHATGQLLARWLQMGVFFPYCRNHSAIDTARQEPWSFGEEVEAINRKYIELRYKWMPYLYSLFYEASQTGIPVMRPLILEYPEDRTVYNLSDQFLLGQDLLIAPIYRPDTTYRTVYLPKGVWYDYWTGQRYAGEQQIMVHAPLDTLPIFARAGTILPEQPLLQYAEEKDIEQLTIHVYGGETGRSSYQLYEDDGQSFAYQSGEYNLIRLALDQTEACTELSYVYEHQGYARGNKTWILQFRFMQQPTSVEGLEQVEQPQLSQVAEGWAFDQAANSLLVKINTNTKQRSIVIRH